MKRCKKCLVFSGANIAMQVQCGSKTRVIRSDILDRDMFDPAANTPEHTSWTMKLLSQMDKAVGPGVMDRPIFSIPDQRESSLTNQDSDVIRDPELGKIRHAVSRCARQTFGFISGSPEGPAYSDRAIAIQRADQARSVCSAHVPSYSEGGARRRNRNIHS